MGRFRDRVAGQGVEQAGDKMSQETDQCETLIVQMLAGDCESERQCRLVLKNIGDSYRTPVLAVADMLRAAMKAQNDFQENN